MICYFCPRCFVCTNRILEQLSNFIYFSEMEEYIQRKEGYGHLLLWLIRLCDLLLINVFFLVTYYVAVYHLKIDAFSYDKKILAFLLINLSYFITSASIPIYTSSNIIYLDKVIRNALTFVVFFTFICTALFAVFGVISDTSPLLWIITFGAIIILYIILHVCIRLFLKYYRRKGYNHRSVVIVGSMKSGQAIYNELKNSDYGYKIVGYFDDDDSFNPDMPKYLGKLSEIKDFVLKNRVKEIYYSLTDNENDQITDLIIFSEKNFIRFFIIPEFFNYIRRRFILRFVDSVPVVSLRNEPLVHFPNRVIKRSFDMIFSLFALLVIFPPILLVVGTLIKVTSPGPIFFKQKRTGIRGKSFNCYKFRSMCNNEDADEQQAVKGDPRITKIGAFIRKTSIDELPQFYNVLIGDMSVVGPRPHMIKHTEEYSRLIDKFMIRHLVKPGITGWAQVSGYRGETKELKDMEGRVQKDVWYIENWSFILDIKIIVKTLFNALKGEKMAY